MLAFENGMNAMRIRTATQADAPAINDILNHYVTHSTATFITQPVSLDERLKWLEGRPEAHPVVVAELSESVVGWGALGPFRTRAAYAQTVEVSVYIHQDYHRRGIGRAIMRELLSRARALGHHVIVGGCCSESIASIGLLESFGFSRAGQFLQVGRKFDRWLDVVFFELLL
jgi:phosphinothricin acetyltransferase